MNCTIPNNKILVTFGIVFSFFVWLLQPINPNGFTSLSWLYKNRPLHLPDVQVLLIGTIPEAPQEPVLWINRRQNGNVIYTSLGHWDDWTEPNFKQLMFNIVDLGLSRH